jgi:hypothetical protein
MWWIALASTASQLTPAPNPGHADATRQAAATVRIVKFATVRMGEAATDRHDWTVRASDTHFRDADGRYRPARIVERP